MFCMLLARIARYQRTTFIYDVHNDLSFHKNFISFLLFKKNKMTSLKTIREVEKIRWFFLMWKWKEEIREWKFIGVWDANTLLGCRRAVIECHVLLITRSQQIPCYVRRKRRLSTIIKIMTRKKYFLSKGTRTTVKMKLSMISD